jgi:hypothetical protein
MCLISDMQFGIGSKSYCTASAPLIEAENDLSDTGHFAISDGMQVAVSCRTKWKFQLDAKGLLLRSVGISLLSSEGCATLV